MEAPGVGWGDVLRVVGALAMLVPLAYVTTRLVGSRVALRPGRAMRLVDTLPLGPGRALYLVEVGGRMLVIGVSGQRMERLDAVTDPDEVAQLRRLAGAGAPTPWAGARARHRREAGDSGSTHHDTPQGLA